MTAADGRPRVYTKTNDASGELTAEESAGDAAWPKAAWLRGKEYLNGYLRIVNLPINAKVGDKFAVVEASL